MRRGHVVSVIGGALAAVLVLGDRAAWGGAKALNDAAVKKLLVGKAVWVRNGVTGEQFRASFNTNGQSIVWHVGRDVPHPSEVGDVAANGYQGMTRAYSIKNGKLV